MRKDIPVFILFIVIAVSVYANSLGSPFIWDDQYLIAENHLIKSPRYIPEIFRRHLYYGSAGVSNFYRPMQSLSLMFDYAFWKGNRLFTAAGGGVSIRPERALTPERLMQDPDGSVAEARRHNATLPLGERWWWDSARAPRV